MSSTGVSLATSSACSSNSSLAGSSACFLESFLPPESLSLFAVFFAGVFSSSAGASPLSTSASTSSARTLAMISSLVPLQSTPKEAANFLKSLYFMLRNCSSSNLPATATAPSFSSGAFIGSSFCAFPLATVFFAGASTSPFSSAVLIASRPAIVMLIPLIISTLFFI